MGILWGSSEILLASFTPPYEKTVPWNVVTSLFRGSLLRDAFDEIEEIRLNKSEDAYEYFHVARKAQHLYSLVGFRGLHYYYGRGISGSTHIPIDLFEQQQQDLYDAVCAFKRIPHDDLSEAEKLP